MNDLKELRQYYLDNKQLSNIAWILESLAGKDAKPQLWKVYCSSTVEL